MSDQCIWLLFPTIPGTSETQGSKSNFTRVLKFNKLVSWSCWWLAVLLTLIVCNYLACMNKRILLFSLSLMSQQINTLNMFKFSICSVTCEVSVNTLGYIEAQVCDIKTDHWATKNIPMLLWSKIKKKKLPWCFYAIAQVLHVMRIHFFLSFCKLRFIHPAALSCLCIWNMGSTSQSVLPSAQR